MPAPDERQLIELAKAGDHEAFRALVERYMKQAYTIAIGVVADHADAQDIVQDAFVKIFQVLNTFRGDAEFSTWMYRIVTNMSLNRVKQQRRQAQRMVSQNVLETMLAGNTENPADSADVKTHIERALHQLPTLQRAVVILRHLDGLSTRQVSNILRCSEGTVKTHLYRGLKRMRLILKSLQHEIL